MGALTTQLLLLPVRGQERAGLGAEGRWGLGWTAVATTTQTGAASSGKDVPPLSLPACLSLEGVGPSEAS